jgi:hypothetical protein
MVGNSDDVLVIGGYPDGRDWDNIQEEHLTEELRRAAAKRIMMLPIPARDPVTGGADARVDRRAVLGRCRAQRLPRRARCDVALSRWKIQSWSGWFSKRHLRRGPAMTLR